ncbi:MAG: hypothetical protein K2R98_15900 [Gemmataceae bacterium]|nr:hypothetical protein [Gemmataceae bacterium]
MKGFITKIVVAGSLAAGLATGCCGYYDVVDPCYPTRYNFTARTEVCAALTPQVKNGHVLDQTVWNWMFEKGTDSLNGMGTDHLIYLLRRRPCPDPTIYLATAEDLVYDAAAPEKFAEARGELDAKRIVAIQKYLTAQTAGRGINFQVSIHDPADPSINAISGRANALIFIGGAGGGAAAPR